MAFDYLGVGIAGFLALAVLVVLVVIWLIGGVGKDGKQYVSKINNGVGSNFRKVTSAVRWKK